MKTRKWKPFSVLTFSTSSTYTSFSPAASTVVSAVKSLVDKELILDEQAYTAFTTASLDSIF